jgi:hypothetical protein
VTQRLRHLQATRLSDVVHAEAQDGGAAAIDEIE